ncbi:MAG: hypothetical protein EAX95_16080 [Candidatus Thorarchaeota archaeon]|nr:hypothetical protein [Candidatus Thorarchaeota archaeon]
MTDDDVRRMIEEATKESLRDSFTEAGRKFIQAAEASLQRGDIASSDKLFVQAAEAFTKAADKYRASKSYKNAALNMCAAGDVWSDQGNAASAITAYELAAEDLLAASNEHILWGEDAETAKGAALAMAACMIYIMIGKEADAFYKARTFSAENASKLRFPAVVRLTQIPQMLESAIQSLDLEGFTAAETSTVTELKTALVNANAQEFVKYVDKGLDMVREILRGKLKIPKISSQLMIPPDMTFTEDFPVRVVISNHGEGEATNLHLEWHIDEALSVRSGELSKTLSTIPPGESFDFSVTLRSKEALTGMKEFTILLRGSYSDKLNTEYSFQAGPGTLVLKDFKEGDKLRKAIDVTDGRFGILRASIAETTLDKEPFDRLIKKLSGLLLDAGEDITKGDIAAAKARIHVINELVDSMDALVGDDAMLDRIKKQHEINKRAYAGAVVESVKDSLISTITGHGHKLESSIKEMLQEQDFATQSRGKIVESVEDAKARTSQVIKSLEALYSNMPSASETSDPVEGQARTRLRTSVEDARSSLINVRMNLEQIAAEGSRLKDSGASPAKMAMVREALEALSNELGSILDTKRAELK